ncbi:MAG TPA: hypothetical protein PLH22_00175 [Candidatus Colwellbacteria bacterium]|nr:hypothetical protein [Candidatus Colwellbacteria bacterium]
MTKYNKICLSLGLLFVLAFAGADLKTAKADYVDYVNGREVLVQYDWDTGKLDLIDVSTGSTIANDLDFTQDDNGRGVPVGGYDIEPPEREETLGITDSSERAEEYSCSQVGVCGTTVIGYNSNPQNPNYALYSATNTREIVTVFLRHSGQSQGNQAWDDAEDDAASLIEKYGINENSVLDSKTVNDILRDLGANFKVDDNIDSVSRKELLEALAQAGQNGSEPGGSPDEEEEEWTPPETGPFVSILECSFTATPAEILYSKSSRLRWNCNRADTCSISDETGVVVRSSITTMSGEVQVSPLKTTRYYLNCSDNKSWETLVRVFSSGIQ